MILICLGSRFRLRYSRQKRNLPLYIVYLGASYPFTQVYEMADWKTLLLKIPFLIMPSCAQAKKLNHAGETKIWSPAGGPIYSSRETNSRFQAGGPVYISTEENSRLPAGGPVYISTEENSRLPAGGPVYTLRKGDIQPLAALPTHGSRESLFSSLSEQLPVTLFQFIIVHPPTICHLQPEELRVGLNRAQKP